MRWGQPASRTRLQEGNLIPRCGFRSPHLKGTLATCGKGDLSGARGSLASASTFTRYPAPEGAARRWPSEPRGGRWGPFGHLASYLEKLRNVPPGQVLLGVVGVHGCTARAVGRRRGGYGSWGWRGAALTWMRASRGLGDSGAAEPSALPPPPRPRWSPRQQRAAAASRAQAARAPGEGRGGGPRGRRHQPPPPGSALSARVSRARCSGRQSRCAGGRGGGDTRVAVAPQPAAQPRCPGAKDRAIGT